MNDVRERLIEDARLFALGAHEEDSPLFVDNVIFPAIREAMLSDEVVKEGYRNLTHLHPWGVRDAIAAALDAAGIGGQGDDDAR